MTTKTKKPKPVSDDDIVNAIMRVTGNGRMYAKLVAKRFTADEATRLIAAVESGKQPRETLYEILDRITDDAIAKANVSVPTDSAEKGAEKS